MKLSPSNKVTGAGAGGTIGVLLIWLLESMGVVVPANVAVALGSLASFVLAWLVSDGPHVIVNEVHVDEPLPDRNSPPPPPPPADFTNPSGS